MLLESFPVTNKLQFFWYVYRKITKYFCQFYRHMTLTSFLISSSYLRKFLVVTCFFLFFCRKCIRHLISISLLKHHATSWFLRSHEEWSDNDEYALLQPVDSRFAQVFGKQQVSTCTLNTNFLLIECCFRKKDSNS